MEIIQEFSYGRTEFHFDDLPSRADFEYITQVLIHRFGATKIMAMDGPGAHISRFNVDGGTIVFVHDDMVGNFFFTESDVTLQSLIQLAANLDLALAQVIKT